jgi:hypothetical protein
MAEDLAMYPEIVSNKFIFVYQRMKMGLGLGRGTARRLEHEEEEGRECHPCNAIHFHSPSPNPQCSSIFGLLLHHNAICPPAVTEASSAASVPMPIAAPGEEVFNEQA